MAFLGMSFLEGLRDHRNRLFASAGFQNWAASFPLTRPVAMRRAARLFDLTAGFVYAQVLQAAVETGLLEGLAEGPCTEEKLVHVTSLPKPGLTRLCKACESLDLLEKRSGHRWALGPQGAALLGNRGALSMIRHHAILYRDLSDPVSLLKRRTNKTQLAQFWSYMPSEQSENPEISALYSQLMADTQAMISREILAAYDFNRHESILDIGGGNGAFLQAIAGRYTRPTLTLGDLPAVADLASDRLEAEGLSSRISAKPMNFINDPIPADHDLITLVRILHDHDDAIVTGLLAAIRPSLAPGARLMIAEPLSQTPTAKPMGEAYFGLYLWAMGSGRPRTKREYTRFLHEAGFQRVREISTRQPMVTRILLAE